MPTGLWKVGEELSGSPHLLICPAPAKCHHPSNSGTATGNVEAKVVCFYRRRDISNTLIMLADKHAKYWSGLPFSSLHVCVFFSLIL
ncbi:hypothetical protein FD755_007429 [Muntiacus reevesi]|uniref:Uncharacterized protein n=1 Tax=Muntiacus reevesi TaxID=9886 RepID=A0A5J5MH24_MUNRE|nr:hypothetical protein FD755_007429 [Muntiacus reevesi]